MISLYDRWNGNKILDLEEDDEYGSFCEEILGLLPGNRLLTKDHGTLYVYSLRDGKLLHKGERGGNMVEHLLLPSKNLYVKEGEYDLYSTQEWSYIFNTTTFETIGISSCTGSFLGLCTQEPYLISWRLKTHEDELEERLNKEQDDDSEEHEEESRAIIHIVVLDSRSGQVVCTHQLPYGSWHENGYDDFDPIDYYGEETLMSEYDWTEKDIHEYRERQHWSSFEPQFIDPPIVGACYNPQWFILYNDHDFEVYDTEGKSIFDYDLRGIRKIWPITDTTIGICVDSRLIEFDLEKRAEVCVVEMGAAVKDRPDLFLGFIQCCNPLSSINRSIVGGEVGKAQLWPDIFQSVSPIEWYSAFRPDTYWFERDERIRVENLAHKRSETIELWYGNRKVTLEEACTITKQGSTQSENATV